MADVLRYFADGNTARGYISLMESNLSDAGRLLLVEGDSVCERSRSIYEIGIEWSQKGHDAEFLHCAMDHGTIDAVIFPGPGVAIVDSGSHEAPIPANAQSVKVRAGDPFRTQAERDAAQSISRQIRSELDTAYCAFAQALAVHDVWESCYIESMDFEKANRLSGELIDSCLGDAIGSGKPTVKHRFLGAATPLGPIDYVPNIIRGLRRRIYLKGRPGTGKSTILKKLAAAAQERGFDTEIYHCGFDPHSLDMVVVRSMGFAVFDSTAPHEYFPGDGDETIDLYARLIKPDTDERMRKRLRDIVLEYRTHIARGTAALAYAKSIRDRSQSMADDRGGRTAELTEALRQALGDIAGA
ncbi:MAG: hypothetical protein GX549_02805 [Clostridiales bacterium]|nr:hypothetical protein [Clostridiales bacterium]